MLILGVIALWLSINMLILGLVMFLVEELDR
jgi:hypothetical protein